MRRTGTAATKAGSSRKLTENAVARIDHRAFLKGCSCRGVKAGRRKLLCDQLLIVDVSSLAKIGNAPRTMHKKDEALKRGVFDLEARRKPQVFAADAVSLWRLNQNWPVIKYSAPNNDSRWSALSKPIHFEYSTAERPRRLRLRSCRLLVRYVSVNDRKVYRSAEKRDRRVETTMDEEERFLSSQGAKINCSSAKRTESGTINAPGSGSLFGLQPGGRAQDSSRKADFPLPTNSSGNIPGLPQTEAHLAKGKLGRKPGTSMISKSQAETEVSAPSEGHIPQAVRFRFDCRTACDPS